MVTAWGTTSSALTQVILYYFNPRSRVGNDHHPLPGFLFCRNFNPRSRVGNDGKANGNGGNIFISTHVPAWGTTIQSECPRAALRFQSTFPRGERHSHTNVLVVHLLHFNPRSRVGNDSSGFSILRKISISIHVPAWGTTL